MQNEYENEFTKWIYEMNIVEKWYFEFEKNVALEIQISFYKKMISFVEVNLKIGKEQRQDK